MDLAAEYRWRFQPTVLDRYQHSISQIPCCAQSSEQNAPTTFQELDLSLRTLVLSRTQHRPCAGTRMELLRSQLLRD